MVDVLKLLLPALFPSWRFFDVIGPSPRIEVAFTDHPATTVPEGTTTWRECRPKLQRMGFVDYIKSFFWNARWNESLYLATCAERLLQSPSEHSSREIRRRLRRDLAGDPSLPAYFGFRLVFVSREAGRLRRDVAYVSPAYPTIDPQDR